MYPNNPTENNIENLQLQQVLGDLGQISRSMEDVIDRKIGGIGIERNVDSWFSLVKKEGKDLFERPSAKSFSRLNNHLNSEWFAYILDGAAIERGVYFETAFRERVEACFIARHKLVVEFLKDPNLPEGDADQILAQHFIQGHYELSGRFFELRGRVKRKERLEVLNGMLGALVSLGLDDPQLFEKAVNSVAMVNGMRRKKLEEYSEYYSYVDLRDSRQKAINKNLFIPKAKEKIVKIRNEQNATITGVRGEIITAKILQKWVQNMLSSNQIEGIYSIDRTSESADSGGMGDFCITTADLRVLVVVETKTEKRENLGTQIAYPSNGGIAYEGDTDFMKPPPGNVLKVVTKYKRPILSVRVPSKYAIEPLTNRNLVGFVDVSADDIIGADIIFRKGYENER